MSQFVIDLFKLFNFSKVNFFISKIRFFQHFLLMKYGILILVVLLHHEDTSIEHDLINLQKACNLKPF